MLFCGINPGLYSGATGHHFARPGNRFWPALFASGFTPGLLTGDEDVDLPAFGCGVTNLVVVPPLPEGPGDVAAWSPEQVRLEGELRPNYVGVAYKRRYEVDGDRLLFSSVNPNERWRVVWSG